MFDCKFIAVLMIFIYKEREREREREGLGGRTLWKHLNIQVIAEMHSLLPIFQLHVYF